MPFPAMGLETRGARAGGPHKPSPTPADTLSPGYHIDGNTCIDLTHQMETVLKPS